MAQLSDEIAAFRDCNGPYPYRDFKWLLAQLGYNEVKAGKTGGARRKFMHSKTGHQIWLHEPHDGEMRRGMVRKLQKELEFRGVI
jgi:hypothetical protein